MFELKYAFFSLIGLAVIVCIIICSFRYKSSKVKKFPHIELFGKPLRYFYRYIPFSVILLVIILTIISTHPYKTQKIFSKKMVYNIVLCIDVSNSMKEKNKLEIAKSIVRDFLLKRDREDRIGIVVFDNLPFRIAPLTSDRKRLLKILQKIHPAMVDIGGTSMYDALIDSLSMFSPSLKNKIIILLSDGGDINSKHTIEDVIIKNRNVKAKIYTVGISSGIYSFNLERLAYSSGGKAFFVTGEYSKALREIFDQINALEPSYIRVYSYQTEKPVDFIFKLVAFLLSFFMLFYILLTGRRNVA